MTDIKWEAPPPDGRSKGAQWQPVADALRDRPGAWALVAEEAANGLAISIKQGRLRAFAPAGSFEVTTRGTKGGKRKVWARYIGEPEA